MSVGAASVRRTVLRIFWTVASGISSPTPLAPYRFQVTKSPAPFLNAKVMALPSLSHLPFCGVFFE